jgi:phosphoribosylformimino-5-aminoimidazole carboxamide ribotide isomerase
MQIIPAIDIMDKKVVRLMQGDFSKETSYSFNPVEIALKWQSEGAGIIHIVDLDGARRGRPCNLETVMNIIKAVDIPVQFGGGIRDKEAVDKILSLGVSRAIIGTKAAEDFDFIRDVAREYNEKIIVSIDSSEKGVMVSGWEKQTEKKSAEIAAEMVSAGVRTLVFSNIARDGMLSGIDKCWVLDTLEAADTAKVIIAGGISSIDDVIMLKGVSDQNSRLIGAITGKAVYEGRLNLSDAVRIVKG